MVSSSKAQLRILATSDLHARLFAHDYGMARPDPGRSLQDLLPLIESARADAPGACLLLDNGDLIEGTALGDAAAVLPDDAPHPIAEVLAAAGYDALGLGNHDLDYGLAALARFARASTVPVLSSNLQLPGAQPDWLAPSVILDAGPFRVGVLSVLPVQATLHNQPRLPDGTRVGDMRDSIAATAAELRDAGADVIVALAHTGRDTSQGETRLDKIAADGTVDALIGGHTHETFPQDPSRPGVLSGVPAVMPGFGGEALGQIDMTLERQSSGAWRVASAHGKLVRAATDGGPSDVLHPARAMHDDVCARLEEPIGQLQGPLHSYFTWIRPSRMMAMAADAQARAIDAVRTGTEWSDLPLLSCVSPPRAGGVNGPQNYSDIPTGPLRRRHVGEFHVYQNDIWAVPMTGAGLRAWLERSVAAYAQRTSEDTGQLVLAQAPTFNADVIFGLTYEIDLSRPPAFSPAGRRLGTDMGRVRNLRHMGRTVDDEDRFLVAANSYRISGGGGFPGLGPDVTALRPDMPVAQVHAQFLSADTAAPYDLPWQFHSATRGCAAAITTGPGAAAYLDEIADFHPRNMARDSSGFLRIDITL